MKNLKLIIAALFLFTATASFSQIPIEFIDTEYIQLIGENRVYDKPLNITIDTGFDVGTQIIMEDGKNVEFDSMIKALNFFCEQGYCLEHTDVYNTQGGTMQSRNVFHYVMKKCY